MVQFVPAGSLRQKFIFNVSTPVGVGARGSSRDDILLVQFYFLLKDKDSDLYRKIKLTGICDEDLIAAIRTFQASRPDKLVQDGLVSRAQGKGFGAGSEWRVWTIVGMNFGFWTQCLTLWPRIDRHPKCNSGELRQAICQALGAWGA
jgi:hypothetical protein